MIRTADPERLSRELRLGGGGFLRRRRQVAGLSLASAGSMAVISLYQLGLLGHLPDPPLPGFDSDRVDASCGSDRLDASVLLMPLVVFLPADDPRMERTVRTIERELLTDGLVRRWKGDSGFLLCTYWLVECLDRCGEEERATRLFEHATARANDLGLLSEQADPASGELWGDFPQAFSHVGLINAASCLASHQPG